MHIAIVDHAIDPSTVLARVQSRGNGGAVLFVGTVRDVNDGRSVSGLEYSAYTAMAESELTRIVGEASTKYGTSDIAAEHRVGSLDIGDVAVAIAAGHAHRGAAFDACRFVIEELKRRVPIWKREGYVDGERSWVVPVEQR